jgi:hypothetical protein
MEREKIQKLERKENSTRNSIKNTREKEKQNIKID